MSKTIPKQKGDLVSFSKTMCMCVFCAVLHFASESPWIRTFNLAIYRFVVWGYHSVSLALARRYRYLALCLVTTRREKRWNAREKKLPTNNNLQQHFFFSFIYEYMKTNLTQKSNTRYLTHFDTKTKLVS